MPATRRRHRKNYNVPGHAHELTFSCYLRYKFLSRDRTCQWLADEIETARRNLQFDLWAYVFMPEHVHLIVHPRPKIHDVAVFRRAIKEPVAKKAIDHMQQHAPAWLARITRTRGDRIERVFWQSGGGYDRNITEQKTLLAMIEYVHHNPVRRGLVERAIDWKWSSAAWYADRRDVPIIPDPIPWEWGIHT